MYAGPAVAMISPNSPMIQNPDMPNHVVCHCSVDDISLKLSKSPFTKSRGSLALLTFESCTRLQA
jgi:hypothetical protein